MRQALVQARRGRGRTSPNPAVGAVLVRNRTVLGSGWHHRAGQPHAEIQALTDARRHGNHTRNSTLYVTLEPCSTHGRTPPCTQAIIQAGIRRVVVGAIDPNPKHRRRGLRQLRDAGLEVESGILDTTCSRLNEAYNHWIVQRTPWVTLKAAMTLDGKIADAQGGSKWITGPIARRHAMRLRSVQDAILVGVNTVLADDPALTLRPAPPGKAFLRVILDSLARTPTNARVLTPVQGHRTLIVASRRAPTSKVRALSRIADVLIAPARKHRINLPWVLETLGDRSVTALLVEGGGQVHASFLEQALAHRVAFFYAPKILADRQAKRAVAGRGARSWEEIIKLTEITWRRFGSDLFLTALVAPQR